jgi:hypothetical protein
MINVHSFASDGSVSSAAIVEVAREGLGTGTAATSAGYGSLGPEIPAGTLGGSQMIEIQAFDQSDQWDRSAAKRFKELAVSTALGTASSDDIAELNQLSFRRSLSNLQIDPELIIFETRYQRAVDELRKFLEQNSAILKSLSGGYSSAGRAAERSKT